MDRRGLLHIVTEPTKAGLLRALMEAERSVSELVEAVDGEQSNVSHHLRALRSLGLVRARRDGRRRLYHLADPTIGDLLAALERLGQDLERTTFYTGLDLPVDPRFQGYG